VPRGSDEDGQSNQALIVRSYHSIDKSFEKQHDCRLASIRVSGQSYQADASEQRSSEQKALKKHKVQTRARHVNGKGYQLSSRVLGRNDLTLYACSFASVGSLFGQRHAFRLASSTNKATRRSPTDGESWMTKKGKKQNKAIHERDRSTEDW
jgi:hypothetical protein